ncbi:hypothetical protein CEXT_790241 [Caerostris extrusa]|uniref:B box-type domain-containing protein n=1 Tax=Caerostris extrusa TaxID=172846 RepID=A0AAV4TMR6_CAEEX|nr:hypothetical protein CEXT_790241 [Caerostris extrusa]
MHCFEGHNVIDLKDELLNGATQDKLLHCPRHDREIIRYFCRTCNVPICKECATEHPTGLHDYDHISDVGPREIEMLRLQIERCKTKLNEFKSAGSSVDSLLNCLEEQLL